jgi:hypothetical protein
MTINENNIKILDETISKLIEVRDNLNNGYELDRFEIHKLETIIGIINKIYNRFKGSQ